MTIVMVYEIAIVDRDLRDQGYLLIVHVSPPFLLVISKTMTISLKGND